MHGLAAAPVIADYASADPSALWQAAGAFTIFDFNWLRRSTPDAAAPIAAGIFLDLYGGQSD